MLYQIVGRVLNGDRRRIRRPLVVYLHNAAIAAASAVGLQLRAHHVQTRCVDPIPAKPTSAVIMNRDEHQRRSSPAAQSRHTRLPSQGERQCAVLVRYRLPNRAQLTLNAARSL